MRRVAGGFKPCTAAVRAELAGDADVAVYQVHRVIVHREQARLLREWGVNRGDDRGSS